MYDLFAPETASAPPKARKRYLLRNMIAAVVLGALITTPNSKLGELYLGEDAGRYALLAVIPLLIFMIREFVVLMRTLDELQFRIHMTALAWAGGVLAAAATIWGGATIVLGAPQELMLAFMLPLHAIGYYIALFVISRRYS